MAIPNYDHQLIEDIAGWNLNPKEIGQRLISWYGSPDSAKAHVYTVMDIVDRKYSYLVEVAETL